MSTFYTMPVRMMQVHVNLQLNSQEYQDDNYTTKIFFVQTNLLSKRETPSNEQLYQASTAYIIFIPFYITVIFF